MPRWWRRNCQRWLVRYQYSECHKISNYVLSDSQITRKQAGAEPGQAQVKLEVIVKVGVEDRLKYLITSES